MTRRKDIASSKNTYVLQQHDSNDICECSTSRPRPDVASKFPRLNFTWRPDPAPPAKFRDPSICSRTKLTCSMLSLTTDPNVVLKASSVALKPESGQCPHAKRPSLKNFGCFLAYLWEQSEDPRSSMNCPKHVPDTRPDIAQP